MNEIDDIIRTAILIPTLNRQQIREACAFIEQQAQSIKGTLLDTECLLGKRSA